MSNNYDYLDYRLPNESPVRYADSAIKVLNDIKQEFPQFYKEFRCPSEVLTLSGVRAFDTYYDLGKSATREEIVGLKTLLHTHGIILLEQDFPFGDERFPDNRYSLVHYDALEDIPNRYKHMPEADWIVPNFAELKFDNEFFLWWAQWKDRILLVRELDPTCKELLANTSWMAHDMTFGMLLGYPGEAIISSLYMTQADIDADRDRRSNVKHDARFDGAHPTYDYLDAVADHPNIVDHQKLWTAILDNVYAELEK